MDAAGIKQILEGISAANRSFVDELIKENRKLVESVTNQHPSADRQNASIPNFRNFIKTTDRWSTYFLQLEQHFEAHGINNDNTKRACILSWIGAENLELLQKLFDSKVKEKSFKEITQKLNEHFVEKVHVLSARFKLYRTLMKPDQSYSDWVAELKGAAKDCVFRCSRQECQESYADRKIRDMIVLHTPHEKVRTAALQKTDPTLEEVMQIATSYEITVRTCKEIEKSEAETVNAVSKIKDECRRKSSHYQKGKQNGKPNGIDKRKQRAERNRKAEQKFKSCPGCFVSHTREECHHYKNKTKCNTCSKLGHISSVCQVNTNIKQKHQQSYVNAIDASQQQRYEQIGSLETICAFGDDKGKIMVELSVNNQRLKFQVDTGATCSVIGSKGYRVLGKPTCSPTDKQLKAYGGLQVPVRGVANVKVQCGDFEDILPLVVANCEEATNILGLNWFHKLKLHVAIPNSIQCNNCSLSSTGQASSKSLVSTLNTLANEYASIFKEEMGLCATFKANIKLKDNAKPVFCKPYPIPFAQYEEVRTEINRLVTTKVLKPINASEWASPIVTVRKPSGQIRLCADFKVGVNPQIKIDRYPIPKVEELFYKLKGGKYFTKIDLSEAYHQIQLTEEAKTFLVINTPFGLYQYQRLPFGVASAPGMFQRFMEELISGMTRCATYIDDVVISGNTDEEHLANVRELFIRLQKYGLHCRREKCIFAKNHVEYVGHIISSEGIRPSEKRVEAIKMMPRPTNTREVETFIGKINYYNKFINNFSSKAAALNILRRQTVEFHWSAEQEQAFNVLKNEIVQATQLVHYNDQLPIILATDASKNGIGAVISHRYPDGEEKPIAFASKTLTKTQVNYSQIEKEALSIIFGVTRFHQFLYGRHFELITDHQALTTIFSPIKKLPVMTMHRLQRWAIRLQAYDYSIRYRHTSLHMNADALSRLPAGDDNEFDKNEDTLTEVHEINSMIIESFPINAKVIADHVHKDNSLQSVKDMIINGWPSRLRSSQQHLKPYFDRRLQLSYQDGVILLQTEHTRVVIPVNLQTKILELLHDGHWGSTRMKQIARRCVWFPRIDQAIETACKNCSICRTSDCQPNREFSPWPEPAGPWERVHLDFAGPFCGSMWIIVVDAYSKFPYVVKMQTITTEATISVLQKIFAIEGLPQTLVSDNGPQLTSSQFRKFCELNNINHLTSAPFHPSSNGLAERFVRTFKEAFTKIMNENGNKEVSLFKYLVTFRSTPNPSSHKSPAELLHGRQPRTLLSALVPITHPTGTIKSKFTRGQQVYARNFAGNERWVKGTIIEVCGRMMYVISTTKYTYNLRRHQNQLRAATDSKPSDSVQHNTSKSDWDLDISLSSPQKLKLSSSSSQLAEPLAPNNQRENASSTEPSITSSRSEESQQPATLARRSKRKRQPVERLRYDSM